MNVRHLIALLCIVSPVFAQDDEFIEYDRRMKRYLQGLTEDDLGKPLKGVRFRDGATELAGKTLLHRIKIPAKRAQIYVVREGSILMGSMTGYVWVEQKGKSISKPRAPAGESRETGYAMNEIHTFSEVDADDMIVELSCPHEKWIKSQQDPSAAAGWGIETVATIEDPDGYTNVRDERGEVIGTVKTGERFLAVKPFEKSAQWEVYLPSGVVGLMHGSRLRPLPGEPLMKLNFEPCRAEWKKELARLEAEAIKEKEESPSLPNAYYPTLLRASEGDARALSQFFASKFDEAPPNAYVRDVWKVLHLAGDARVAELIARQRQEFSKLGAIFSEDWTTAPISDGRQYLKQHFPITYAELFGR